MVERLKDGRVLALLAAMLYTVLPIDLVPDVAAVGGTLDDLGVSTALTILAWWWSRDRAGGLRDLWPLIAILVYDLSPVDLVPELVLPGVGQADDAAVSLIGPLLWAWWTRRPTAPDAPPVEG